MKKKTTLLEMVLFSLVLALSGALIFQATQQEKTQWDKAEDLSNRVIKDLAESGWAPETVEDYASPSLKDWMTRNSGDLDTLNKSLIKLGGLKEIKSVDLLAANKTSAVVITHVEYDNGKAAVTVNLKNADDKWLVDKININSPQLKQEAAEQAPARPQAQAPAPEPAPTE